MGMRFSLSTLDSYCRAFLDCRSDSFGIRKILATKYHSNLLLRIDCASMCMTCEKYSRNRCLPSFVITSNQADLTYQEQDTSNVDPQGRNEPDLPRHAMFLFQTPIFKAKLLTCLPEFI